MIALEDMEFSESIYGNFSYKGYLENGDIVEFLKYAVYDRPWEWRVYVPEDYPIQAYARNYRGHEFDTEEECLEDFFRKLSAKKLDVSR